jgi:hypothetical protein
MYKLVKNEIDNVINSVRIVDGDVIKSIPFDPANTDYQAFLAWKEQGNEPLPAEE